MVTAWLILRVVCVYDVGVLWLNAYTGHKYTNTSVWCKGCPSG